MNQIIIHVGLHKTGTTFLQQNIFKPNCNTFLTYDRLTHFVNTNSDIKKIHDQITQKDIRVKYLDQEDIESLGFKHKCEEIYDTGSELYSWTIQRIKNDRYISHKYAITYGLDDDRFIGIIKNKSELKRILKQIGYDN